MSRRFEFQALARRSDLCQARPLWNSARRLVVVGLLFVTSGCGAGPMAQNSGDVLVEGPTQDDDRATTPKQQAVNSIVDSPVNAVSAVPTVFSPGLLAEEFTWHRGAPPVTMIQHREGFAVLTGVQGALTDSKAEIGAVMDAAGDWILSGTPGQPALSGQAVAVPWFLEIDRPVEFKTWQVPQADYPRLIQQRDGFCVLLMVGGEFRGTDEQFRLRVDDEGWWRLQALSQAAGTRVRVMVVKANEPGSFHGIVREHHWRNDGRGPIRMIHSADGFAFLSGLAGTYAGDGDYARVRIGEDGYWYLEGSSDHGVAMAWAVSMQLTGTDAPLVAVTQPATTGRQAVPEEPPVVAPATPPSAQGAAIYGEWEIIAATENGNAYEDLVGDVYVIPVGGKELTMHLDGNRSSLNTLHLDCALDESRKYIDYSLFSEKLLGIYRIDGDRLTLCFNSERPADFTSTADNENRLLVLKRLRAPSAAPRISPAADGWTDLFNGRDLTGWQGFVANPRERSRMSPAERSRAQTAADRRMREHWKVVDGVLEFDGQGESLCTVREFGDFELTLDWRIESGGDSGVYLRGCPQVQIWDTKSGKPDAELGSGGLFNNSAHSRWPDVCADRPVGQWNTFVIRMVGESVTVDLNGRRVVDNVIMDNYFEPAEPVYPAGPIQLQRFGGRLSFRNIRIWELNPTRPSVLRTPIRPERALVAVTE